MGKLFILLALYVIFLAITFSSAKGILIAPQVIFVICFIPQIVLLIPNVSKWSVDLSDQTFWILFSGPIIFYLASIVGKVFFGKIRYKKKNISVGRFKRNIISSDVKSCCWIPSYLLIGYAIFQEIVFLLTLVFLLRRVGGSNLSNIIFSYRLSAIGKGDEIQLSGLLRAFRTLCITCNYYFAFPLAESIVYKDKKNRATLIVIMVTGIVNCVILGARGGAVQLMVAFAVQFYMIALNKREWKSRIQFKNIIKVIIGIAILFPLFQYSANWLGRNAVRYTSMDYLSMYLSAEVKNLDTFVRAGRFGSSISDNQTFCTVINFLAEHFSFAKGWEHQLYNPFRSVNGFNLGNVSTVYYAPMYDWGYIGVVIYLIAMALFCQYLYKKSKISLGSTNEILPTVIYSYVFYTVLFSFFSPKFSEIIINPVFIKMLIALFILDWFIGVLRKQEKKQIY